MKIYRLTIEEIQDQGYDNWTGGDHEHDKTVRNRTVLDEMFSNIDLISEQLNSIKEFNLTFHEGYIRHKEDKDVFSGFTLPTIEELTSRSSVEVDVVKKSHSDEDFDEYSWYHHFFSFTLKEYDLKESIVEEVR